MQYGKLLMDAFFDEAQAFRARQEYGHALVMDAMESAVNNVMHGRPAAEVCDYANAHVREVLADVRIELLPEEREAYMYALDVIESVPLPGAVKH